MSPRGKKLTTGRRVVAKDADIGARLRSIRIGQNLSQELVANKLNISFQQVQKYEKGTNRISGVRLVALAEFLNTTPHEILGWNSQSKETHLFNSETYKLALAFNNLKPELKSPLRHLIESIMRGD
jgi:transcriptional regulator with XRE-family HTH domain